MRSTKRMRASEIFDGILAHPDAQRTYREIFPDGWVATFTKYDYHSVSLDDYRTAFVNNQVSAQIIRGVLDFVAKWRRDGIAVYAFRPPTTATMVEIENANSGFDQLAFVKQFEQAGGIWIDVNQTDYRSYDACHLHRDDAIRFSRDLADRIAFIESGNKISPIKTAVNANTQAQ